MCSRIAIAHTDQEILDCYPVMAEPRPHILPNEFLPLVKRLGTVAYLDEAGIKAVAGFRISEWLAGGRYLDIEDLVTTNRDRSKGYGGELFDWLVAHAKKNHCQQVRLVSRINRHDAHRFYLRKGMKLEAHYFSLNV